MPGELLDAVLERIPGLNLSRVLQDALRELLGCDHEQLACRRCAAPIARAAIVQLALTRFYSEAQAALGQLVRDGGSAEGAARALREVAMASRVQLAADTPAPRATRTERDAVRSGRVEQLPAGGRRRPPRAGRGG